MKIEMKIKITKKGAVFTISAIVITGIMLAVFFSFQETPADYHLKYVKTRVKQTNNYLNQIDDFVQENLREATSATLNEMVNNLAVNGFTTPADFDKNLYSCIINESNLPWCSGQNSLQGKLTEFSAFGQKYVGLTNLTIKIKNGNDLQVTQTSPWTITTNVNLTVYAQDGFAEWNITNMSVSSTFPIYGMRDPTYFVKNGNAASIGIVDQYKNTTRVIFTREVSEWNTASGFNSNMGKGMYFNTTIGVSYLDRLRNNISASSCCGIASFLTNDVVNESQRYSKRYKETYGNYDILFFKQVPVNPWTLQELNFWNNQPINLQLPHIRGLVGINITTGANINQTIIPSGLTSEVYMPNSVIPQNYTVTPTAQSIGDGICALGPESCDVADPLKYDPACGITCPAWWP